MRRSVEIALRSLERPIHPAKVVLGGCVVIWLIGVLDVVTGPEVRLGFLYMLPAAVGAWLSGAWCAVFLAFVTSLVQTYIEIKYGSHYVHSWTVYWNLGVRIVVFGSIGLLVAVIRGLIQSLNDLVQERTAELRAEVANRKQVERVVTEISAREQQRLGADLHDQLAGHLTGLAFMAKALSESLQKRSLPEAADAENLVGYLNHALRQLRAFCRLLAPVDTGNLEPGLTRLGAQIETAFGVTCIVQTPKDPPQLELNRARLLYNIAQEAVRNAVEKRMAKLVEIQLTDEKTMLRLTVTDDGAPALPPDAPDEQDLTLKVMRYRAETLGGEITVGPGPQGGSRLCCKVGIESGAPAQPFPPMS